jgi:ribose transport system ATP-binding protein
VSTDPGPATPVLSLRGISKRFGAVQALRDVSVECLAGEVHAVVGENGSGKSTLLGVASGILVPDDGSVEIAGTPLAGGSAAEARELGLSMAYQTYSHVLPLTVAENLYLAAPAHHRPPFGSLNVWAAERLEEFDLEQLPPTVPIGSVPLPARQLLEVVKALLAKPAVLLLDEPTTALGPAEVERLHELVLREAQRGVGIVYVSHRLPEVLGIASRVTVLRDGVGQGTMPTAGLSEESLVALMIGRPLDQAFPERRDGAGRDEVVLSVSGMKGRHIGPIDLALRRGEILGIAGAAGNGQTELLHCLSGAERPSGTISCNGRRLDPKTPHAALRAGIVLLSGDRVREALFPVLSVRSNATIQVLRRFAAALLLRRRREASAVERLVRSLKVRTPSIEQPVRFLSGGNQQKVALMRPFLRGEISVVVTDEPTQGVDVASRFDIYEALRAKANEGVAVIVNSSDPIELSGLCDRVVVLSRGRIVDEIPAEELGEQRIIEAIVGGRAAAATAVAAGEERDGN